MTASLPRSRAILISITACALLCVIFFFLAVPDSPGDSRLSLLEPPSRPSLKIAAPEPPLSPSANASRVTRAEPPEQPSRDEERREDQDPPPTEDEPAEPRGLERELERLRVRLDMEGEVTVERILEAIDPLMETLTEGNDERALGALRSWLMRHEAAVRSTQAGQELSAISTLRNIASSQAQLQASGAIDIDGDGAGTPELPFGGAPEPLKKVDAADLSERAWCAYAWPSRASTPPWRAFFVNQHGDVYACENTVVNGGAGYHGNAVPPPAAAFATTGEGLGMITGEPSQQGRGQDGGQWIVVR